MQHITTHGPNSPIHSVSLNYNSINSTEINELKEQITHLQRVNNNLQEQLDMKTDFIKQLQSDK